MPKAEPTKRPDPAVLLSQIEADEKRQLRGRLKIFFGSSAGTGKTYAMLQEAHRRLKEGLDVVAGIVETHDRHETKQLLEGLPVLPLQDIDHRGVKLKEFDLDGALKRKPAILLVDELAHTNAAGCRHLKRWQDVEELLVAGIDVYTTLNVQHLESLNDVVGSITGIAVREMVPDSIFDEADDIIFVDTPPDELLNRLREGKVYIAPGANERAIQNFFRKTNLQSLRELALRRTADYVDADTDDQRRREGLSTPNIAGDRIMVCIGPDMFASKLVRTGKRLAAALKSPWDAVYVETPQSSSQDPRLRHHIQHVMASAERNGADVVSLQGARIGDELLNYARNKGITKILIGKSVAPAWRALLGKGLPEYILSQSGDIDVYVVTTPAALSASFNKKRKLSLKPTWWKEYLVAALSSAGVTVLGFASFSFLKTIDMAMLYLVGVMCISAWLGRGPSLLYSVLSIAAFDFFFVHPQFTFAISDFSYTLTFLVMFVTSIVISTLATKLRDQMLLSRRREHETQMFYGLTKELTATRTREDMSEALIRRLTETARVAVSIWYPDGKGYLNMAYGEVTGDHFKEETVVKWCFDNGQAAGAGTDTMPSAARYYLPIRGTNMTLGVVGVKPEGELLLPDQTLMIETFVDLLGSALERSETAESAEKAKMLAEREKMRNILLSSVSHDLRSPLSVITGAADTLLQNASMADNQLLKSIRQEASRLTRVVSNLLDITRIEGGQIRLNMHPYFPAEIIGSAVESCKEVLKHHKLVLNVPEQLPYVKMDGLLMSQVIQNLLENAANHTPQGTAVTVEAGMHNNGLHLVISDNGPGIPLGQEKEIFNKFATFAQGDRPKGAGLGLSICQAVVMAHLGRIYAENKKEGGSRFVVELPATLTMPEPE
jgi:two-component system sensor histidine kinase KdpD